MMVSYDYANVSNLCVAAPPPPPSPDAQGFLRIYIQFLSMKMLALDGVLHTMNICFDLTCALAQFVFFNENVRIFRSIVLFTYTMNINHTSLPAIVTFSLIFV